MPNFSSLAGLKVAEKFVVVGWSGGVGGTRDYCSNSNACCFRVALGFDNGCIEQFPYND